MAPSANHPLAAHLAQAMLNARQGLLELKKAQTIAEMFLKEAIEKSR